MSVLRVPPFCSGPSHGPTAARSGDTFLTEASTAGAVLSAAHGASASSLAEASSVCGPPHGPGELTAPGRIPLAALDQPNRGCAGGPSPPALHTPAGGLLTPHSVRSTARAQAA